LGKLHVFLPDRQAAVDHLTTPEYLDLEARPNAAPRDDVVDQRLHRVVTVASRGARATPLAADALRQQEMIHAADAKNGIAHADGDAGSEDGDKNLVGSRRDIVVAEADLHLHHSGFAIVA